MATILVIDDEESVRSLLINTLKRTGHTPIPYPDGAPALAEVDFSSIDLVLTDLAMPTPGETVIRTIRERGLTIPIIVLSGILAPTDANQLRKMGADMILPKPTQPPDLVDAINQLLS